MLKEGLIKLWDKLNKPILYKYSKEQIDMEEFYVIDKNTIYVLKC